MGSGSIISPGLALQRDPAFIDWQKGTETPSDLSRSGDLSRSDTKLAQAVGRIGFG